MVISYELPQRGAKRQRVPLFEALKPARVRGENVTFESGARTAWHAYRLDQASA